MKIRIFLLLLTFSIHLVATSQIDPEKNRVAPRVIPPPPNASALTKYSGVDVALSSGMVTHQIPLYTLSGKNLSLPVSLRYSSNGVKVDEYPSLVGMSWVLEAGGVITRTVKGAIDDDAVRRIPPIGSGLYSSQMHVFLEAYNNRQWEAYDDTEADLFSYDFLGNNGKFVLDENKVPVLLPMRNLKIEVDFNSTDYTFKVTDASGIIYYFGGDNATEETYVNNTQYAGTMPHPPFIKTSFYLKRIVHPFGETIHLLYDSYVHTMDPTYIAQTNNYTQPQTVCTGNCQNYCYVPCPTQVYFSRGLMDFKSRILSEIRIDDVGRIEFNYSSYNMFTPATNGAYKKLGSFQVTGAGDLPVKTVSFSYSDAFTMGFANGYSGAPTNTTRPFLSQVLSGNEKYKFEYYSPSSLPVLTSFSQDHWGFFNGKLNTDFISDENAPSFFSQATADRYPDPDYAVFGLLKRLVHPTGGVDSIIYEGNRVGSVNKGGMRVKALYSKDHVRDVPIMRRFFYGPLTNLQSNQGSAAVPVLNKQNMNGLLCSYPDVSGIGWITTLFLCQYETRTSNTVNDLGIFNGGIIAYNYVTESLGGDNFENGGIEHQFRISSNSAAYPLINGEPFDGPKNYNTMLHGTELSTKIFKMVSSTPVILSEVVNNHEVSSQYYEELNSYTVIKRWDPLSPAYFDGHDLIKTIYSSYWERLGSSTTKIFDENGQNPVIETKTYTYGSVNHLQPTRIETLDSKGNSFVTDYKYPEDFVSSVTPNVYNEMISRHMLISPVETIVSRNGNVVFKSKNHFRLQSGIPVPDKVENAKGTASYQVDINFDSYDNTYNLTQFTERGGIPVSYIYDHYGKLVIAEGRNATVNNIAFTSFEADGKGGWAYAGAVQIDNTAPAGRRVYALAGGAVSKSSLSTSTTYIISYWKKTGTVSVNATASTAGETVNGWTYYEHKVVNPSAGIITVSGTGIIDELRLYPSAGQMQTLSYEPMIGISSMTDVNNRIGRYEYDQFQRLHFIRDVHKNILQKFCYNYAGMPENCDQYFNQVQSGVFGRNNCPPNYTGSEVTYTVPANTYSSSSLTAANAKAMADVQANGQANANKYGTCTPPPCNSQQCTANGPTFKCVGGLCQQGIKVVTSVVQLGVHLWECTYHYEWSDGSWSQNYTEQSAFNCSMTES